MNKSAGWLALPLLLFLLLLTAGCSPFAIGDKTGPPPYPDSQAAADYALKQGLLTTVTDARPVHLRFIEYGPTYAMVTGENAAGEAAAVWFTGDGRKRISPVGSVRLQDGLTEAQVLAKLQPLGQPKQLFLAPMDLPERESNGDYFAWYVQMAEGHYLWLDFASGEVVQENRF